jgi:hypothetical protein
MRGEVQEDLPIPMDEDGGAALPEAKIYYMVHPSVDVDEGA